MRLFQSDSGTPATEWWLLRARLTLAAERLARESMPLVILLALFVTLALFEFWRAIPFWMHAAALLGFAVALGWACWRLVRGFRFPARQDALRRLERDSAIKHQALRALGDRLPGPTADPITRSLWARHQERLRASLGRLRLRAPSAQLAERDPWALRALVLLVLVVGLVEARGDYVGRLWAAVVPSGPAPAAELPVVADLWVTPPTYTRRAPLSADFTAANHHLVVPTSSEALLQLHNLPADNEQFAILFDGTPVEFERLTDSDGQAQFDLATSGQLLITGALPEGQGEWAVEVVPDHPPSVVFTEPPQVTRRQAFRLAFAAEDDYGLAELVLRLAPSDRPDEDERLPLLTPPGEVAELETSTYHDLTAHPLAGLPVELTIEASDGLGQIGRSAAVPFTLPEREFLHPLARDVIAQRKRLVTEPDMRAEIATRLALLGRTEMAASLGATVPLSLGIASRRTADAEDRAQRREVMDLLWELALFIEEGTLSTAERELRALQERLQEALMSDATDAEIERLMQELQQAMDRFLEELTRQALEQMQNPQAQQTPMQPVDPSQMVRREDLQEMLDRAREMMQSGARDAARQMLSQLQEMLENLQAGVAQQMQQSPGQQSLSDLQRMMQLQQDLLDRSFRMQQEQQQGIPQEGQGQPNQQMQGQGEGDQPLPDGPGRAAAEQEGLRRALGELMRRLGENGMPIPRSLGQAEMQMRDARQALDQAMPGEAAPRQAQALDLMQQGGQAMLEQLQKMAGDGPGQGSEPYGQSRQGRDPLGRAQFNDGGADTRGEFVPDDADLGRARGVLEELQRRSGERSRPQQELDYYDRLLDRF